MELMQAGFVAAVAVDATGAHDKLCSLEFDWLVCRRRDEGGEVDAFLDVVRDEGIHGDVLRLLLLSDGPPPPDLERWPLASIHLAPFDIEADELVDLIREPSRAKSGGGAVTLPAPTLAGPLMIGSSPAITRVSRLIARVAQTDSTALITGESGTGKELAAQSIHMLSARANGAMVPLNCGAIPAELLESELFGHARGAFTGANANRKGRVELADRGTLFLDEIGEMPIGLQPKLLRVLQEQEYSPLGSEKTYKADVRIVAATNQNLEALVEARTFREDLYYRLNVIPIQLPPLRDRREDIPELIGHFLAGYDERFGAERVQGITQDALDKMVAYDWPGNIRELKNIIERMVILCEAPVIRVEDLPEKIRGHEPTMPLSGGGSPVLPQDGLAFYEAVEEFEKSLIVQALDRTDWNKNQAASILKMNRTTLVEKIKKRNITRS